MKKVMKKFIVPALLVILPFLGLAQIDLSGKVIDRDTQESLPGAHIRLLNTFTATATDKTGTFNIRNLKQNSYTLVISYVGYKNDTSVIDLTKITDLSIALIPATIMEDGVIVYATRAGSNTPVAHQNIDKKEIAAMNFGQDLPVLLGNSVSAVTTSDAGNGMGYTALRIRGTDMTRINVTINGMPLNDPESHNVFWVDLPDIATSTDNIQIQRGVGTSTNGASAFGASINLQTSQLNTEPYVEINSAYGSYNTLKNSISFGTGVFDKHFSMDARISKLSSDGYIDRATSDLLSYYISGAYTSNKNLLRVNIFSGKEKTYQAWDGIPSTILDTNRTYNGMGSYYDNHGVQHYYSNETDNYSQTHFQTIYSYEFTKKLFMNAAVHHTVGAGYYEQYRESDDLADYGIDAVRTNSPYYVIDSDTIQTPDSIISYSDLIRQKHLANAFTGLTWSLNYHTERLQTSFGGSWNTYSGNHFGRAIWAQFTGNSEINHEWYRSKSLKNDFNIFAKTEYALTSKLTTWVDLQYRTIYYKLDGIDDDQRAITQNHTFNFFNPKAGASYHLSANQNIYASVSVANREPNRDNFVDSDPAQPVPQPERLYDTEAGYSFSTNHVSINVNSYYMYYHEQLVLTGAINDVGAPIMVNVPSSYRAGIEFSAKALLTANLKWEPSVTFSQNKIKSFTEYIDNWDTWSQTDVNHTNTDLSFSPSLIANSSLSWMIFKGFNMNLVSKFVGRQYIDNTESSDRQLDPYFVNNLLINYKFKPRFCKEMGFSLMINNIFNEKYESNAWVYRYSSENSMQKLDGYYPQAGVNLMAGVSVKF
jgi:iron complex outermembrane receptor protein